MQDRVTLKGARIAVVGLGYVGLPLAIEFSKKYETIGYDINAGRIDELRQGRDGTREVSADELASAGRMRFTHQVEDIAACNVYIVTVPTPINEHKQPDFSPLLQASQAIGSVLAAGDVVIYESTVFPGATEEICVPVLERASGLSYEAAASTATFHPSGTTLGRWAGGHWKGTAGLVREGEFGVGYSPERINPGDRERRLTNIPKITSGSSPATAKFVDALYSSILTVPTHPAPAINVAEAAKVIENTQRDVNIALINEFSLIFRRLGIDTHDVLDAAATKWNFLPFRPGLVGGHCIGVDPYYLIQKAQSVGYHPEILLACRRINDAMGRHVASEVVKLLIHKELAVKNSRILVLGLAFKENCPDLRNTRVIDLLEEFRQYGAHVDIHDPWVDPQEAEREYGIDLLETPQPGVYDAVVLAVAHDSFREGDIRRWGKAQSVVYDIKGLLPVKDVDGRL